MRRGLVHRQYLTWQMASVVQKSLHSVLMVQTAGTCKSIYQTIRCHMLHNHDYGERFLKFHGHFSLPINVINATYGKYKT